MRTLDELEWWLAQHDDFQDGCLAVVDERDGRVTLRLVRTVPEGRVPGAPRAVHVHELVAEGVLEFVRPAEHAPDHCLEEVVAGSVEGGLFVEAFVPGRLYLAARSFTARHVGTEWDTVPPYVVEHEFTVLALPDGGFWTERVGAVVGAEVVWRAHGSGARTPGLDPDGCFLQRADALDSTVGGVWCARGVGTTFSRKDSDADLWRAVRLVAAQAGSVRTGNCVLAPEEWLRHVDTGELPPVVVTAPPG
ncbi:MAG: hypothetical protein HOY78_08630 [Saccharothrix sp.]|nr:hypothetical protein [Saccharothrix sp.]